MDDHESVASATQADDRSTIEDDTRSLGEFSRTTLNDGRLLVEELVKRCDKLLGELEAYQSYLAQNKQGHNVEVKPFRNSIAAELKSLEKLRSADPEADRTVHTLRSSNLPFYTAVWDAAKTTSGLVTFTKRFYWDTPPTRTAKKSRTPKQKCALVDIVAQDGQQWIKVSTVTETRLLFDLAKAGWEGADSDSETDDEDGLLVNGLAHSSIDDATSNNDRDPSRTGKDDDRIEIIRQAQDLQKASLAYKVHYKHPSITFILPKISPKPPPEVIRILDSIRSTGAAVRLGPSSPPSNLDSAFQRLVSNPFANFTPTLNIDCTILLALVSDLSHCATTPEPWFHQAISRQIEVETREQLLPSILWPAMADKRLICTQEAAKRMREIVDTIGTETERKRSDLLLHDLATNPSPSSSTSLQESFAKLSNYTIPSSFHLPILVVPTNEDLSVLPAIAQSVKSALTAINQSVFMHGWAEGCVTLTSNRSVKKQIEEIVENEEGEVEGPRIWLCNTARSLVGKEKGRRDLGGKGE
ncbi:MAG: hypothetical protein L6R42_003447 [Xanthoria sp. 1 TBL-2021]|nr:MAG: hypothetical protein L6R42_003447 [Xanthoria sp. 1 TBL-2021]